MGLRPVTGPVVALAVTGIGLGATLLGQTALALAVMFAQVLLVLGWFMVLDVPAREIGIALAIGAGVLADLAMLERDSDVSLGPLAGVLGPALVLALVHQFVRSDGRGRVTASLTATMTAVTLSVLAAALVAERAATQGQSVTVVAIAAAGAAAALAAAAAVAPVTVAPAVADGVAVAGGTLTGLAAGALAGGLDAEHVLGLAVAAAVLAVLGRQAATFAVWDSTPSIAAVPDLAPAGEGRAAARTRRRAAARQARRSGEGVLVLTAALPLVLAAPAAYVLGRLLVG